MLILFIFCIAFSVFSVSLAIVFYKRNTKIKKELESYQTIIDYTHDALIVLEIVNGKIIHVNQSATQLFGFSLKEFTNMSYAELMPKSYLIRSSEIIADVWENKGLVFTDIPHLHKNGHEIPIECSAKVGEFDEHPAIVIYARDITERLKYENEIKEINRSLHEINTEITDSIKYAKRIQQAILPDEEDSKKILPEHFVLFMPKDFVSGDFYFIEEITTNSGVKLAGFATVDCTGHGVPGAFMSLLGHSFFKQALIEESVNSAGEVLDFVNKKLNNALKYKEAGSVRDGMDVSFGVLNSQTGGFYFAGAYNPCLVVSNCIPQTISANKRSLGQEDSTNFKFDTQFYQLNKGDMIYLYSDGYADQFGGPKGKKFKYKQLDDILIANSQLPCSKQKEILKQTFIEWKGNLEQVDDVMIIGVRY